MSHYHEQFLKQNPLAVLGVLRDLHKAAIPLRISWNGGQLISKILAITPDKLVLDFGSQAEDNNAVLKAQHITITVETQGAKVEFTVEQLQQSEYLQLPAFITVPPPPCGLYNDADISASPPHSIRLIFARPNWRITVRYVSACMICR